MITEEEKFEKFCNENALAEFQLANTPTLRDRFAMAALIGLLSCNRLMDEIEIASRTQNMTQKEEKVVHPRVIASISYEIADALLEERKK